MHTIYPLRRIPEENTHTQRETEREWRREAAAAVAPSLNSHSWSGSAIHSLAKTFWHTQFLIFCFCRILRFERTSNRFPLFRASKHFYNGEQAENYTKRFTTRSRSRYSLWFPTFGIFGGKWIWPNSLFYTTLNGHFFFVLFGKLKLQSVGSLN